MFDPSKSKNRRRRIRRNSSIKEKKREVKRVKFQR
jgi:hypothetical protein